MGVKGAIAVSAALRANSKIRSLNLGDNWLCDEGVASVAEVLTSNATITSLNLSENHIGLPGVRELCRRLQARGGHSLGGVRAVGRVLGAAARRP